MLAEKTNGEPTIENCRYKGLLCGIVPIYVDFFPTDKDTTLCMCIYKPYTSWIAWVVTWVWDTVAMLSNRKEFIGQYSIRITDANPSFTHKWEIPDDSTDTN